MTRFRTRRMQQNAQYLNMNKDLPWIPEREREEKTKISQTPYYITIHLSHQVIIYMDSNWIPEELNKNP